MRNLRIAFLAICVSILAFWIGRNAHRNKATFTPPQTVRAAIDEEDPIEREPLTSFDSVGSVAEPTIPEESTFALANELLISFSNIEAMNEFELKAKQRGLRILDRSEALASLRLQYRNEADRNLMGRLAGDDASIDRNYIVVTPTLPESPANVGSRAFADGALDWIGIREDNSSWGKGVTVAILDTAILDHASLTDASIRVVDLAKSEGSDQEIYNSHGTAVASLVAGADIGVAPSASIIGIQVMESNGTGDSFTLAQGIVEAVDQGASVISMSLGSYGSSAPLENAINYALERDVVLVASAGNDSFGALTYPARHDGVIGVTAIDSASQTASFSNFGLGTDIAAPGVGIYAAWNESEWASFSGTSASTPLVAGSVAAILSLEPNLQPNEAADLLLEYANDSGPAGDDLYLGAGALNIERVLERNQRGIADASVADIYLDTNAANQGTIPLQINVENRGTETLRSTSISFQENDGMRQRIYLGSIPANDTATHTLYLNESLLEQPSGYSIQVDTILGNQNDDRPENDSLSRQMRLKPSSGEEG